ncbi:DUF4190 domain-containing protein [Streptomyces halobius]|uniref:DUF4352 domain-containing protein n=1 Tax=Streptomyces halobius TaxID=2879846 RepID=A0ABY4MDG3_9ACTN|nr:DUF4190 domain-containing protein [Streptomyces halobius]UQA95357.1 hypothetical protein K9S39_28985 [Streptomyces halobius]
MARLEHTPGPDPWAPPADVPAPGFPAPFPPAPQQASNGLGIASLVTGIVGVVLGFIPFLFWLSGVLGLLALIFGLVGHSRARKGLATNKAMPLVGTVLGGLTVVLAIIGLILTVVFVKHAADKVKEKEADRERTIASPAPSEPVAEKPLRFGETRKYADGVTVTVAKPVPYQPGSVAVGHEEGNLAIQVKVTIVNGSKKTIDITSALPTVRDANGASAGNIFDGDSATKPFSGKLLPGKKAVSQFAHSVSPDGAKELQLEVGPDNEHEDGIWIGAAR